MSDDFDGAPLKEEEVKPEPKRKPSRKKVTPKTVDGVLAARAPKTGTPSVSIRNLWPGRLIVKEDQVPSRSVYDFPHAGSVLLVMKEDVDTLLARHRLAGCCGAGQTEQKFFELA